MITGPIALLILDGFGDGPRNAFDATFVAGMPAFNDLRRRFATTQLLAGGEAVGLPEGQFGNSEVGHMNLGAGRVVWQELTRIDAAIKKGTFRQNEAMGRLLARLKASGKRLHLMGLVSPGGVHSHQNHLVALAQWAQDEGRAHHHPRLPGRPRHRAEELRRLPAVAGLPAPQPPPGEDRAASAAATWSWTATSAGSAWSGPGSCSWTASRSSRPPMPWRASTPPTPANETDEFVSPTKLADFQPIQDGDGIIFFNFRADRARQFSHALVHPDFSGLPPGQAAQGGPGHLHPVRHRARRPTCPWPIRPRTSPTSWASWSRPRAGSSCAPPRPRSTPT